VKNVTPKPSETFDRPWLRAISPGTKREAWNAQLAGKWCVFRPRDVIDETWLVIRAAVEAGGLPLAKVSTCLTSLTHGDRHVICIYTEDWRDDAAVFAARDVLRTLGFVEELGYKRDIETINRVYGTAAEWYRRA
jgi:hypothetical protein